MDQDERKRLIEDIFRYCSTQSILIINVKGELERLNCPFLVLVIRDVSLLKKGQIKPVSSVRISLEMIDVYVIESVSYYYFNFKVLKEEK